jgi:hypothetical protein
MATDENAKFAMESRTSVEKPACDVELVEDRLEQQVVHVYAPRTAEENALDSSINMKLDFIVLPLLAFNFMVYGPLILRNIGWEWLIFFLVMWD